MKNTVILLIFLLSILGLILGVYYTEDANSSNSDDSDIEMVNENSNSIFTIFHEKKNFTLKSITEFENNS